MNDLETVLNTLKKNKSKYPYGFPNELFKPATAGHDLKVALLTLMNRMKTEQIFPEQLEHCTITSIFKKGKVGKNDFNNYRGIFRVSVFRSILDRLIFNDYYGKIDDYMTDCNVGGRRGRNIRDNLFVLSAITNNVSKEKGKTYDIAAYDIEQCFDALWAQECINDLWDAGCQDDKLSLLHLENQRAQVVIKNPGGNSSPVTIDNVIVQGGVMSSIYCTNTMDKLGKIIYEDKKLLYNYKGTEVPCLQMVDDILTITECDSTAIAMNSTVNTFVETKKLKLAEKKCSIIHVGKQHKDCPNLRVHQQQLHKNTSLKYLGDIVHESGKVNINLIERRAKAYAIFAEIRAILEDVPLGKYRVEVGLQLRQAMFINGVLFNSEVWHGLKPTDLDVLSVVEHHILKYICKAQ